MGFINNGPKTLLERKRISNEGIIMGGLIDCLLYEPDLFKEKYHVGDIKKPTASLGVLADFVLSNFDDCNDKLKDYFLLDDGQFKIDLYEEAVDIIYDMTIVLNLWSSIKTREKKVARFMTEDFIKYLYEITLSKEKEFVTSEQHSLALEIIDILKNHKYTKHLFKNKLENYYQFEAKFEYNGFNFLGYIDHVQIDHENKTICAKDLKTGTPKGSEFFNSFLKYKYYIQGLLYTIALESIKKQLKVEDYTSLPFEFVYISRYEKVPVIYQMTEKYIEGALKGFTTNRGIKYPGLDNTLKEIQWHLDNDIYNTSRWVEEKNGLLELNSDIITINEV